jgi:hypothetical protein
VPAASPARVSGPPAPALQVATVISRTYQAPTLAVSCRVISRASQPSAPAVLRVSPSGSLPLSALAAPNIPYLGLLTCRYRPLPVSGRLHRAARQPPPFRPSRLPDLSLARPCPPPGFAPPRLPPSRPDHLRAPLPAARLSHCVIRPASYSPSLAALPARLPAPAPAHSCRPEFLISQAPRPSSPAILTAPPVLHPPRLLSSPAHLAPGPAPAGLGRRRPFLRQGPIRHDPGRPLSVHPQPPSRPSVRPGLAPGARGLPGPTWPRPPRVRPGSGLPGRCAMGPPPVIPAVISSRAHPPRSGPHQPAPWRRCNPGPA